MQTATAPPGGGRAAGRVPGAHGTVETRHAGLEPRPLGAARTVRGSEKVPKASSIAHRVSRLSGLLSTHRNPIVFLGKNRKTGLSLGGDQI